MLLVLMLAGLLGLTSNQAKAAGGPPTGGPPVIQLVLALPAGGVVHDYDSEGSLRASYETTQELLARISGGYSFRTAPGIITIKSDVTDAWILQNIPPNMGWDWLGGHIQHLLFDRGYDVQHTQYAVYYDGDPGGSCSSPAFPNWPNGLRNGLTGTVFLTDRCGSFDTNSPGYLWRAALMAHVMVNALGAAPPCALHKTMYFYVADDPLDLMAPAEYWIWDWRNASQVRLDAGHDDYFDPSGRPIGTCTAEENLANSPYLETGAYFELRVDTVGNGQIVVNGQPCPTPCDRWLPKGPIQLSATPGPTGQVVWSGACSGTSTSCSVDLNGNSTVTATFKPKPVLPAKVRLLVKVIAGKGSIRISGKTCTKRCPYAYDYGTSLKLVAKPATGYGVLKWSVDSCGRNMKCVLKLTSDTSVSVWFAPINSLRQTKGIKKK